MNKSSSKRKHSSHWHLLLSCILCWTGSVGWLTKVANFVISHHARLLGVRTRVPSATSSDAECCLITVVGRAIQCEALAVEGNTHQQFTSRHSASGPVLHAAGLSHRSSIGPSIIGYRESESEGMVSLIEFPFFADVIRRAINQEATTLRSMRKSLPRLDHRCFATVLCDQWLAPSCRGNRRPGRSWSPRKAPSAWRQSPSQPSPGKPPHWRSASGRDH